MADIDLEQTARETPHTDLGDLTTHGTNCGYYEGDCTCSLKFRVWLATEREMHAAWRKRAEEAERELTALREAADAASVTARREALEPIKDFLEYAGAGKPYPWNRLERLLQDEQAKCRNGDNRDYWRFLEEKLAKVAANIRGLAARPGGG